MRNLFSKYILPAVLVGVIGFVCYASLIKLREQERLYNKAEALSNDLEELNIENDRLRAQIASFQNPDTIDMEARQRLNLKKEDEHVVIILPPDEEEIETTAEPVNKTEKMEQSWWDKVKFFFTGE